MSTSFEPGAYDYFWNHSNSFLLGWLDFEGRVEQFNPAWSHTLGINPTDVKNQPFSILFHPEAREAVTAKLQQLTTQTKPVKSENRFLHQDGSFRWLAWEANPAPAKNLIYITAYDITSAKESAAQLHRQNSQLEVKVQAQQTEITRLQETAIAENLIKQEILAKIRRRNQEIFTVEYTGATIAATLDLEFVLETISQEMIDLFEVARCDIFKWDSVTDQLTLTSGFSHASPLQPPLPPQTRPQEFFEIEQSLITRKARQLTGSEVNRQFPLAEEQASFLLILPMEFQERVFGIVTLLDSQIKQPFEPRQVALAQHLANLSAGAIANAQIFVETQHHLDELSTLYEISQVITSSLNLQEALAVITQHAHRLLGAAAASVALYDPAQDDLWFAAASGEGSDLVRGKRLPWGQGIVGWVVKEGEPAIVSNVRKDSRAYLEFDKTGQFATRSILCVPLWAKGQRIGAIEVINKHTGNFTETDLQLLSALAAPAAIAIENAQLFKQTQMALEETELLYQMARTLVQLDDEQTMFKRALTGYLNHFSLAQGSLLTFDKDQTSGTIVVQTSEGKTSEPAKPVSLSDYPLFERLLYEKTPLVITLEAKQITDSSRKFMQNLGIEAMLLCPITLRGENIGFLEAGITQPARQFTEREIGLAKAMTNQLGVAIQNVRLYQAEQRSRQEAEALHRTAVALVSTIDLDEVIDRILIELERVVPFDSASVQLLRDHCTEIIGGRGFPNLTELLGFRFDITDASKYPLNHSIITNKKPMIVDDVLIEHKKYFNKVHAGSHTRSWLGVPMVFGQRIIGLLSLDKQRPNFYTEAHAHLATGYAAQAAIAIENARLYKQAQQEINERKRVESELKAYREQLEILVQERTAELEQAVAETAAARDRMDAIVRSVADGLIVTNLEKEIILANPAAEALFEFNLEEVLGSHIDQVIENKELRHILHDVLAQPTDGYGVEIELKRLEERHKFVRARSALVDDRHNRPLGMVTIIQDVTRLREVDRLKTEFITTAAHELRTPLTSVLGFSEILLVRELDETRQRRYLNMLNEQATHLSEIVDRLVDVSRLETDAGLELELEPIDIGAIIKNVVSTLQEVAAQHKIELKNMEELPPVQGDEFRLRQISRNLLLNAVNYSPEGSTITISSRTTADYLEISIEDQGIGITVEQQEHLFKPFYRADASDTAIGGMGLGLALSKLIIEQHGGRIWLEPNQSNGTIIYFTLPRDRSASELQTQEPKEKQPDSV